MSSVIAATGNLTNQRSVQHNSRPIGGKHERRAGQSEVTFSVLATTGNLTNQRLLDHVADQSRVYKKGELANQKPYPLILLLQVIQPFIDHFDSISDQSGVNIKGVLANQK
jgi:hypothetical protein